MKKTILSLLGVGLLFATQTSANAQTLINGAGSTFDYPAFTKWFEAYGKIDSNVRFNYQSIGSGGGQKQLLNQTVEFGASDAPMTDEALSKSPGKILHIPVVAGGEAVAYNLPGNPKLKLDADALANMYLGNITKWNDPKIAALNPGIDLPNLPVVVVHRSDGSGTTFIFCDYLCRVSPVWADTIGKGTSVKWPAGLGGKGNEGVAGQVEQLPGAIGYVELAYAVENKMTYAEMKNAAGNFVSCTLETVSAALATAKVPDDFRFSMVNAPGDNSYPIAGASWVLVYQHPKNHDHARKLVAFLKWAVTDGQKLSPQLGYAPLPDNVVQRELKLLDTIKY
ncbi:MAG TPA: phosphate ABC transporter substrate-binding protein PstS [Candidatus Angelobacter sp.]|nr:phosphate ABC transporter substrate-binding protein PstS [Candidatus Angelobacter sp.]